jgi:predicted transcriptional regulator
MSKTVVLTTRVPTELSVRIDELAHEMERSRAWVVAKAIERYVEEELEMIEAVREGERDFEEGRTFTQEQVEAMFSVKRDERDAA